MTNAPPTPRHLPDLRRDLVLSGEVHYFRLDPDAWADRLDQAVACGVTAVATDIPWLVHELPDGTFDLGERYARLDVARCLDLAADKGLAVAPRPGPFVMAELENEGLGCSVLREHPEIRVAGWDGGVRQETVIDHLHPDYLAAARRWYEAILPILAERLPHRGGPVVAVQPDNEVGMLPLVLNSPDLSDATIAGLVSWLIETEGAAAVGARYGLDPFRSASAWRKALRSPSETVVLGLHRDLGRCTRARYARYVRTLARWCRELGVTGVPSVVNVHGCWEGRASALLLGISQLYEAWADDPDILPGTDYYVGDLTLDRLPGLWASNAFLAATAPGRAVGSMEFEVGTGDRWEALDVASGPEAAPLTLQLCLAQGSTFVNHYLLTGGRNPALFAPVGDGNDRISFTGERHGVAAPIDLEVHRSPGYGPLARITTAVRDQTEVLGAARPETPPVALGFVPDHVMTEYCYPPSARDAALVAALEACRGSGSREVLTRALVTCGFAPDAVNVQDGPLDLERVLALAPTPYLADEVRAKLVTWVRDGGRLLLHGPLPPQDMLGRPATTLIDALGLEVGYATPTGRREAAYTAGPQATPLVVPASGHDERPVWDVAELSVGFAQPLATGPDVIVLARLARTGEPCAVELPLGWGGSSSSPPRRTVPG